MPPVNYRTILADPPWDYAGKTPPWRSTSEQTYELMPLQEICELPVGNVASGDAHLYLWCVLPMMRQAYQVVEAWGFTAETMLTWCKPGVGLGGGFRGNTEHVIVARKGWSYINPTCDDCGGRSRGSRKCGCNSPVWRSGGELVKGLPRQPFRETANGTWYESPRKGHSEKPELFIQMIERMSHPPYLEMFARQWTPMCPKRDGWHTWGNELPNDVDLSCFDG